MTSYPLPWGPGFRVSLVVASSRAAWALVSPFPDELGHLFLHLLAFQLLLQQQFKPSHRAIALWVLLIRLGRNKSPVIWEQAASCISRIPCRSLPGSHCSLQKPLTGKSFMGPLICPDHSDTLSSATLTQDIPLTPFLTGRLPSCPPEASLSPPCPPEASLWMLKGCSLHAVDATS